MHSMAKRLNKKVALIGSLFLVIVLFGVIFLGLRYSKDPYEYINDAEELLAKVNTEVGIATASNDYSEEKIEEIEEQYKLVEETYKKAYGCARTVEHKVEILFSLAELNKIDNAYHPKKWKKLRGCWMGVVNIDPKHIGARMKLLKYYYEAGDSRSQAGGGSTNPVWRTVETTATDLVNILKDTGMEEDLFVLKAKARATLEIVMSGQTTNAEKSINDTIAELRHLLQVSPSDADIYLYLARAQGELGKLLDARSVPNSIKKAEDALYAILIKGRHLAEDKAKIEAALLNFKVAQAKRINDKTERIQKIKDLRVEYETLANIYNTNAKVYTELAGFYMSDDSLANAIDAIEKAIELDDANVQYALVATTLYYNDFSINKKDDSLNKAIKLGKNTSKLPDAQKMTAGPREQLSRVNYYSLLTLRGNLLIEKALWANEMGDEEEKSRAISEAELLIHNIKQFLTENKIIFAKWDGLLAMAKGDNETAIRELFMCQAELKATERVDPLVSYFLSRILADRPEIGARVDFLAEALFNRYKSKSFVSIAITKPEALLDYAKIMLQLQQLSDAITVIDIFDERVGTTERSKQLRALAYIRNGQLDDAKLILSELDSQLPETISIKIGLLTQQILRFSKALESTGSSSLEHESLDGESYSRFELGKYRKERVELIKELLKLQPEQVPVPRGICDDMLRSGDKESALQLIEAFLEERPENTNAKLYRRFLREPDPLNIPSQRRNELRIAVLNEISDETERHIGLGLHYNSTGELDLSQAEFEKALAITPDNQEAVSGLFDIAIANKDIPQVTKMAEIAYQHNLDKCEGEFFGARLDMANESFQDALKHLDRCLELRPIFPYALLIKSQIYLTLEDYDNAVEMAKSAAVMNTLDGTLAKQAVTAIRARNTNLGMNVSALQRKELEDFLVRAITLNTTEWQLQVIYAELIMDREPDKAIALMQSTARQFPTIQTSMLLGKLAMKLGIKEIDKEQKAFYLGVAGKAFETAYTSDPSNNEVLDAYSEYLRITSRHEEAKQLLGDRQDVMWQFHVRDGQFEKAKEILLALYETNPKDNGILKGLTKVSLALSDHENLKRYSEELLAVEDTVDNKLLQIHYFLETQLFDEAEIKLASFRKHHKDETRGIMLEAWSKMSKGEIAEALVLIDITLKADPENAIAWRLSGQINMLNGDIDQAIRDLQKSKSIEATSSVQLELANAHRQNGNMNEAIGVLVQAVEDDRASLNLWAMLERLYIETGRRSDLGQFYNQVLRKYPESPYWLFRSGVFALQDMRFLDAEKLFLKSWKQSNESTENMAALDGYFNSLQKSRKHEAVLNYAQQYIETESAPVAYLNMANSQLYLGNRQKALECYNNAIEKSDKNNNFILKVLREMSKTLGPQEVTQWCNNRIRTKPDSLPANLMLCTLAQEKNDFQEALRYVNVSLGLAEGQEEGQLEILAMKGQLLVQVYLKDSTTESLSGAIEVYEAILKKRPNNSGVMNNLAYLYVESDQKIDQAVEYAKRAHEMSPADANKMDTYAYTLYKIGKYKEAEQLFQEAIHLLQKQNIHTGWEVFYHHGMAQEALGQFNNAKTSYELALKNGAGEISEKNMKKLTDALDRI